MIYVYNWGMKIKPLVVQKFGTISAFAVHLGKSRQYITDVCNGKRVPGRRLALQMSEALNHEVSAAKLLGLES